MGDPNNPGSAVLAVWAIASLGFIGIGVVLIRTPAERHLSWDRRTGHWIYRRRLQQTGDEKQALAAAATFYRWFGVGFIGMGSLHFVLVTAWLVSRLLGG